LETLRLLLPGDLDSVMGLSTAAGWNQTLADWRRVLDLEPSGCFGLETGGTIVATSSLVSYGDSLAWLGMVLTHPDHRGRGYGGRVTTAAMEYAWQRRVRVLKLDATDMGRPLYARLGFRDEAPIERWSAEEPGVPRAATDAPAGGSAPDAELDRRAFGADRAALLSRLPREIAAVLSGGYALARPGARALQLGPCVARDRDTAAKAIGAVLARRPPGPVFWDLLPSNPDAVKLAAELGFTPVRRLMRMSILREGPDVPHDDTLVYAAAGFEYG
jgi:GNAT superfamily N-acetyltransferase